MTFIAAVDEAASGATTSAPASKPAGLPRPAARPAASAPAQDPSIILDTSGFWRCFAQMSQPVVRNGDQTKPVVFKAPWLNFTSPQPPDGWAKAEFDDSQWHRMCGPVFSFGERGPASEFSPMMAVLCIRGRFAVADPAAAGDLVLSATYRGGTVVYLNGREVARAGLPGNSLVTPALLAEDYKDDEPPDRTIEGLKIPADAMRKGVNVLAVEVHRAAYRPKDINPSKDTFIAWGSCGVKAIRLSAPAARAGAIAPNASRPKGFQVWNSNPLATDFDMDWGDPNEPVGPISIVGCRNGAFSGKVVVGSAEPIKGLAAKASDLTSAKGGKIPAGAVQVRYAQPTGAEEGAYTRYLALPGAFDALEEAPPAEAPVWKKEVRRGWAPSMDSPGMFPVFGAVVPVWVTVHVPADAQAGDYEGKLTITADGAGPVVVPIKLAVSPWRLPNPGDFRTFVDIIQSPETLAMYYDVPMWGERHFELMARSLKLLGQAGCKVAYIPLIARTNQGNEQTMVRWIKQADGGWKHDFTVMDKYLDAVEKNQGKPAVVCIYVSDYNCNKHGAGADVNTPKVASEGLVPVTAIGEDGNVETVSLPSYGDPKAADLWKPVIEAIRERLRQRGLQKAMMFGIAADLLPDKTTVDLFRAISPDTPWISGSHPGRTEVHGQPVGYTSAVWNPIAFAGSGKDARYGWKQQARLTNFPRSIIGLGFNAMTFRGMGEANIAGSQRGFSRLGGDFWPVLKDPRGRRAAPLAARFPETTWRNLDVRVTLLAPGKDGAISTARFEQLREGVQECEARIAIEGVLSDDKLKATAGDALAGRCQQVLGERIPYLRMGLSTMILFGVWVQHADIDNSWWQAPPQIGAHWYAGSLWQERSRKLFDAAAEITAAAGGR
ncbi:MAG: glycoside hydrolase domain-containing protein [Phycisphaerae bacterium]